MSATSLGSYKNTREVQQSLSAVCCGFESATKRPNLPVYWQWMESEKVEEASAVATTSDKRPRHTPSKTPRVLKKFCPSPASPRRIAGNVNVRRSITKVSCNTVYFKGL